MSGRSAANQYSDYTIAAQGTILRMALSSVGMKGGAANEVNVNLVLNDVEQKADVTKHKDHRFAFTIFSTYAIKVPAVVMNFVTKTGASSSYSVSWHC